MGTHPIFESDFDCLTGNRMARGVELGEVTQHNVRVLRLINQQVFPVSYNHRFYRDILSLGEWAKLAFLDDLIIGAVCARVESTELGKRCYIMTLGCLGAYRRLGVGSKLLEHVLTMAKKENVNHVTLHVQTSNNSAIEFYQQNGFKIVETKEGYYKKIEPADAYVLQKEIS